jgi:hypothetical protein
MIGESLALIIVENIIENLLEDIDERQSGELSVCSLLCILGRSSQGPTGLYFQSSLERVEDILPLICGLKVLLLFESGFAFSPDAPRGLDGWADLVEGLVVPRDHVWIEVHERHREGEPKLLVLAELVGMGAESVVAHSAVVAQVAEDVLGLHEACAASVADELRAPFAAHYDLAHVFEC